LALRLRRGVQALHERDAVLNERICLPARELHLVELEEEPLSEDRRAGKPGVLPSRPDGPELRGAARGIGRAVWEDAAEAGEYSRLTKALDELDPRERG
jgi:hypothetical protein